MHDGNVLSAISAPEQNASSEMPTQVVGSSSEMSPEFIPQSPAAPSNFRKNSSNPLYLVIGLMGVVILGMAVFIFLPGNADKDSAAARETQTEADDKAKGFSNETRSDAPESSYSGDGSGITSETPLPAAPPKTSPAGRWTGDWSSPSGAYLTVVFDLQDNGPGNINGQIEWTLRKTNRPEKQSKVGLTAIEYVSGRYDPAKQVLALKGYRKDDPNGVLVMVDDYRLNLSGDNRSLNGSAKNGGKWNGRIRLSR